MEKLHKEHTKSRKGDMAEYYAVTWLWDQGYEVFKNCGCSGAIDLKAMKDGTTTLIDVKTIGADNEGKVWGRARTEVQVALGLVLLTFNSKTRKINFVEHKE